MELVEAARMFAALGYEPRLAVFNFLLEAPPEGLPAGRISDALRVLPNTMSSALAILTAAGLLGARREGREIYYFVRREGLASLTEWVAGVHGASGASGSRLKSVG